MLVKIEARILIFSGTDFHFPSTSVPPGTFLGSDDYFSGLARAGWLGSRVVSVLDSDAQKDPGSNRSRDAVG